MNSHLMFATIPSNNLHRGKLKLIETIDFHIVTGYLRLEELKYEQDFLTL